MIQFSQELGYDTLVYCLDPNTAHHWHHRHPETKQLLSEWEIKSDDVLIVSEEFVWAITFLSHITNKYIILNQGLNASLVSDFKRNTYTVTKILYQGAMGVIANSKHTLTNVAKLFDVDTSKMYLYKIHIHERFKPCTGTKGKIVTYMPRKNTAFGCFVLNYISGKFLDYEFVPIHNMNQEQVAETLSTSSIFLSFGGPEGFGMPPLEAALAGCKVIGFDGGGGAEFFQAPIFENIPFYDHMKFIGYTEKYMNGEIGDDLQKRELQREELRKEFSLQSARESYYNAINSILGVNNG